MPYHPLRPPVGGPSGIAIGSLTLTEGITLILGTIVGCGIFVSPGIIISETMEGYATFYIWIAAAITVLCGSLCYLELLLTFKESAGEIAIFDIAYGRTIAEVYAWTQFMIVRPSSQAIIATVFSNNFTYMITQSTFHHDSISPYKQIYVKFFSCVAVWTICGMKTLGVGWGIALQNLFSSFRLLVIILLIVMGFSYLILFNSHWNMELWYQLPNESFWLHHYAAAYTAALWCYDGWNQISYFSQEFINPEQILPKAIISSILIVSIGYLLLNWIYLIHLPMTIMKKSTIIGIELGMATFDSPGALIIACAICFSSYGALHNSLIIGTRHIQLNKQCHYMPWIIRRLVPFSSNHVMILQGMMASILISIFPIQFLLQYAGIVSWCFHGLAAYAIVELRYLYPDVCRPYEVWGYPFLPFFIVTCSCVLMLTSLFEHPFITLFSIIITFIPQAYNHLRHCLEYTFFFDMNVSEPEMNIQEEEYQETNHLEEIHHSINNTTSNVSNIEASSRYYDEFHAVNPTLIIRSVTTRQDSSSSLQIV